MQWHHGWRSDPAHQRQSLTLIEHASVPFAFSTDDPILDGFRRYPDIRAYIQGHCQAIVGTGLLLVDTRRTPAGRFGALGFPCFS